MTRMTKSQLVDENIRLRANCNSYEQRVRVLEEELALANAVLDRRATQSPGRKPQPAECANYWDYVAACRAWCREHNRPVSYLSRDDYLMARQEAAHA